MLQPEKVATLRAFPHPQTKKHLCQFMGLEEYYSQFIPDFTGRASSLMDMLLSPRLGPVWWTTEEESAFRDLWEALSSSPVLQCPDFL